MLLAVADQEVAEPFDGPGHPVALPAGVEVECCVPSTHPAAAWCLGHGFVQSDEDVWCTTDGVLPDAGLAVVHPGLW